MHWRSSHFPDEAPQSVRNLIRQCCAYELDDRLTSTAAREWLDSLLKKLPDDPTPPPPVPTKFVGLSPLPETGVFMELHEEEHEHDHDHDHEADHEEHPHHHAAPSAQSAPPTVGTPLSEAAAMESPPATSPAGSPPHTPVSVTTPRGRQAHSAGAGKSLLAAAMAQLHRQ